MDFVNGTVSLQDMTMAREARYPLFRTESVDYVRSYYEEQYPDPAPVVEVDASEVTEGSAMEAFASDPSAQERTEQERTAQETPENVYDGETNTQEPENAEETEVSSLQEQPEGNVPEPGRPAGKAAVSAERREEEIEQAVFDALQESGTDYGDSQKKALMSQHSAILLIPLSRCS